MTPDPKCGDCFGRGFYIEVDEQITCRCTYNAKNEDIEDDDSADNRGQQRADRGKSTSN